MGFSHLNLWPTELDDQWEPLPANLYAVESIILPTSTPSTIPLIIPDTLYPLEPTSSLSFSGLNFLVNLLVNLMENHMVKTFLEVCGG